MNQKTGTQQATDASGASPDRSRLLQRQCACGTHTVGGSDCSSCKEERDRFKESANGRNHQLRGNRFAPSIVSEVLESPGEPLDAGTRAFFEPRFGKDFSAIPTHTSAPTLRPSSITVGEPANAFEAHADATADKIVHLPGPLPETRFDLSHVRVHHDQRAAESARAVNAHAYTVGSQIVFGPGQYSPESLTGRRLMAHELTHVLQQNGNLNGGVGGAVLMQRQPDGAPAPAPAPAPRAYEGPEAVPAPPAPEPAPAKKEEEAKAAPKFEDTLDYDAICIALHKAMEIVGTDEEAVYYELNRLRRDQGAIDKLTKRYKEKYEVELIDEIESEFSGSEKRYALQLINKGEGEEQAIVTGIPTSVAEWRAAGERLREAFETFWGTDEEAVYAVLTPFKRQMEHVEKLKLVYFALYKERLRDRIDEEMSGSELDYALWLLGEQPIHADDTKAEAQAGLVLTFIKLEAEKKAKTPPSIDASSEFYKILKSRYLSGYLAKPSAEAGKEAAEEKIGRPMEGKLVKVGDKFGVMVRPKGSATWRPAKNDWEVKAITWLNKQELPTQLSEMKDVPLLKNLQGLPRELGAATDILIKENTDKLPYIDIPFLLGKVNPDITDINADVRGGGRNISQLMHWATGVKYAKQSPEALRELFLAYEMWHLEGFDVFGQDAINDMIAEQQGAILGRELMKGEKGEIKSEADLLPLLNRSFIESRAWVGTILRLRQKELDGWILSKQQKPASMHWMEKEEIWPSLTVYQMLADNMPIEEVKKSFMVETAIEIYTLVYEANEWDAAHGAIVLTDLEKALVSGKLDKLLEIMAKAEAGKASLGDLITASGAIKDLKGAK
jgi:hypothetical protein